MNENMDQYYLFCPSSMSEHDESYTYWFKERLENLYGQLTQYLEREKEQGRRLTYCKAFFSDLQNQHQDFLDSTLYQQYLQTCDLTLVEQPPVDGSKITLLVKTSDEEKDYIFQSLRLTDEEAKGQSSYLQTMLLFNHYIKGLEARGLNLRDHCVRTWIYVADIDVNYDGVVRARNDIFRRYGLTADTHYIASTGIGGYSQTRHATVAIDFLTVPSVQPSQLYYLQALDHLNPTHEYGVAFERGTRLTLPNKRMYFISGTASIDRHGDVLYLGDVKRQTERLLENIRALLKDGDATMEDIRYFIIYLRDISDYAVVDAYMQQHYPAIPRILVSAKVCRPQWLIEMEAVAEQNG